MGSSIPRRGSSREITALQFPRIKKVMLMAKIKKSSKLKYRLYVVGEYFNNSTRAQISTILHCKLKQIREADMPTIRKRLVDAYPKLHIPSDELIITFMMWLDD